MARILLIDDCSTVFLLVRRALAADGHRVERLEVFTALPQLMRAHPPDVIVLDLAMPAISGRDIGPFIRKCEPRPIPVIIHSSTGTEQMEEVARSIGAFACVPKGDSLDVLRRAVRQALASTGTR